MLGFLVSASGKGAPSVFHFLLRVGAKYTVPVDLIVFQGLARDVNLRFSASQEQVSQKRR